MSDLILALILMIGAWTLGTFINYFFKGNRMFKLQPKPTFWAKVPISIAGSAKTVLLDIEFNHLNRDSLREYLNSLDGREDVDSIGDIVAGWKGVDEEFSMSTLEKLLSNYPGSAMSLVRVFAAESIGSKDNPDPKTKN